MGTCPTTGWPCTQKRYLPRLQVFLFLIARVTPGFIIKLSFFSIPGDPALDYIGIGGAHQAPDTYQQCREEQRSLAERLEKEFTPIPAQGSKAYKEYQTVNSRNNFLKGLRYRAKLNYRAYGPFVHDSAARAKHQSRLANLRHDAGFTVFLDLVREDMFSLEATRQQDVFNKMANDAKVEKKKN